MGIVAVGQAVPRHEDPYLLRGEGRYTADVNLPGQVYGYVLRSPYAFAKIRSIDTSAAKSAPGVIAVYTGADVEADGLGPLPTVIPPVIDPEKLFNAQRWPLATNMVRLVGHEVAFVVAESLAQAKDAAELIEVDYEPLDAVTNSFDLADKPVSPRYEGRSDNLAFNNDYGNKEETEKAFAAADQVVKLRLTVNRVAANPMENRTTVANYDTAKDRWTVYLPTQGPFAGRAVLANLIFKVPEESFHIIAGNVGGSFGTKAFHAESILTIWAAKKLGRPVKWENERQDSMISDIHGRDKVIDAELAMDKDGKFLGLRVHSMANLGAFLAPLGIMHTNLSLSGMINVYTTPTAYVNIKGAYSNTTPTGPYRGSNRPDSTFIMERIIDFAAAELGLDRMELRRKNLIPASAMPYTIPLNTTYDCGDFASNMEKALAAIDYAGFEKRREESKARGKLRGFGLGNNVEQAVGIGQEFATVRMAEDGSVTVIAGTTDQGQGHTTMYKQVISEQLGIDEDMITVVEGDTDSQAAGGGTGGSRVSVMGTNAARLAGDGVIEKGKVIAGHILEAAAADIEFANGAFTVAGTDKSVSLPDVAKAAFDPTNLPDGVDPGLEEYATYDGKAANYPNGTHVCEVEVDPDTGDVELLRYIAVNDVGRVINPLLYRGQILGGIAQGAGQVLMEGVAYDAASGQMQTGSFLDYAMPRGSDFCDIEIIDNPTLTESNPLGAKGAGEVGCACSMPAVANAIIHALEPYGVKHLDMPMTPDKVWAAIHEN